jgi:hypothetical protein
MGYIYLVGGVILFCIGVIDAFMTGNFRPSFYIYTLLGFSLVILGVVTLKKTRHTEIADQTRVKVNRMAGVRAVPVKRCPACGAEVEAAAKACPVCTHRFPVVYALTVFSPFDVAKREKLIKYLMIRFNQPYESISIRLEKGMVFRYSNRDTADKNGASFESLGCTVKIAEVVREE